MGHHGNPQLHILHVHNRVIGRQILAISLINQFKSELVTVERNGSIQVADGDLDVVDMDKWHRRFRCESQTWDSELWLKRALIRRVTIHRIKVDLDPQAGTLR